MALFNKNNLSKYIATRYKKDYGHMITPIKLQKSLYLCFAHYGSMVFNNNNNNINGAMMPEDATLFDAVFEAWDYGPVEVDVYQQYKLEPNSFYCDINVLASELVSEDLGKIQTISYIDYLLPQIFEINDFKLVELTHLDESWKSKHQERNGSFIQANRLDNDQIIKEYATRQQ